MKHLFFLFLLLPALAAAQRLGTTFKALPGGGETPPPYSCFERPSAYQLRADSILLALDKTQVPSGILYDRTAGTAYLDLFNRAHNDLDTSNVSHFLQAYYEVRAATYNEPGALPCRRLLAGHADRSRRRDTLLLGVLRYRFHVLDTLAVRDNLLAWNNAATPPQLLDVAGRPRSPYVPHEVAVAAALADSLPGGAASFRLDPGYLFSNVATALSSASIDFGDGTSARTLTPGQAVTVGYGTTGWKTLRYTLTYADGSQFTTYSRLWVRVNPPCSNCADRQLTKAQPPATKPLSSPISRIRPVILHSALADGEQPKSAITTARH